MKLKRARENLANDLNGKYAAQDIDSTARGLNEQSTGISYIRFAIMKINFCCKLNISRYLCKKYSDMGRVALGNSTPESWHAFSEKNRDEAEECIRISVALRDLIETDIADTSNDLESQRLATNYAFRNRIHEVKFYFVNLTL